MQTISANLASVFNSNDRDLVDVVEFYDPSHVPSPSTGFDPVNTVQRFSSIEGLVFAGQAYRREAINRSDVSRFMGEKFNTASVTFSSVDGFLATWVLGADVEGLRMVIRCVSLSFLSALADSLVLFVGRADKPVEVDSSTVVVSATQDFGSVGYHVPPRTYGPNDPLGRLPSDPLFEGFRFTPVQGSLQFPEAVPSTGFFGRIFGRMDTVMRTLQYSSHSELNAEEAVPMIFGRCQMLGKKLSFIDRGTQMDAIYSFGEGPISAYENVRTVTRGWTQHPFIHYRYGYPGGTGGQAPIGDGTTPGDGYYSRTAWVKMHFTGSPQEREDPAPDVVSVIKGMVISLPNGAGSFILSGWSHNPAYIAREILTNSRLLKLPTGFIDDAVCIESANYCREPLLDRTQAELLYIPTPDLAVAGTNFHLFRSTGILDSRRFLYDLGIDPTDPYLLDGAYIGFNPDSAPTLPALVTFLRERYTFNAPITEKMPAVDFLFSVLAPCARLFFVISGKGQIQIKVEKPADNTHLRAAVLVGATTIPVDDVLPWVASLQGKILVGGTAGLTTTEARRVTATAYTTDANSITLASVGAGGVTATASGATLTGGTSAVRASGTITLTGTPAAGATVTVTINGIAVTYTLDAYDTLATTAAVLKEFINATPHFKTFVEATSSGAVVTIRSKWGVLTLDSALANAHTGPVANPTAVPALAAAGGGVLAAGIYKVAYSYVNALGQTLTSPIASVTLTANQQISVTAITPLPAGVTSANWYVSRAAGDWQLAYLVNNNGAAFSINSLPANNAAQVPEMNTTGEEEIRVAMSFASNNQTAAILAQAGLTRGNIFDGQYKWPLGSRQKSINQIKTRYREAKDDFALIPYIVNDSVHQARINKENALEIDLSGVDNYHQAARLANAALSKNREGDWFNSIGTGDANAMLLEEGDIISACDVSGGFINVATRTEELRITPEHYTNLVGRKYSTLMFSDQVARHAISLPTVLRWSKVLSTEIHLLDLPMYRDVDSEKGPGFIVAIRRATGDGDWKGSSIWLDFGAGYIRTIDVDTESVMGVALNVMPTSTLNPYTFDATRTVRVQVYNGQTLTSATDDQLLNGANLSRLGGEIFKFKTVAPVGGTTNTYDLTGIYGGLHGTEAAMSTHATSEEFTLLNGAEQFVPLDANWLNKPINVKAVSDDQDVADATAKPFTWSGAILRPLTAANFRSDEDSSGNKLLEFEHRVRFGGGLRDFRQPLIGEEQLKFQLRLYTTNWAAPLPNERVMDIIPGMTLAAALVSTGAINANGKSFSGVTDNTLTSADVTAASLQTITQTGNHIEAGLEYDTAFGGDAEIGIVSAQIDWRSAVPLFKVRLRGSGDPVVGTLTVWRAGSSVYTHATAVSSGARIKIVFSGTEIRFHLNGAEEPFYRDDFLGSNFPIRAWADTAKAAGLGGGTVRKILIKSSPHLKTIYAAGQRVIDYGSSSAVAYGKLYQISALVGKGQELLVQF